MEGRSGGIIHLFHWDKFKHQGIKKKIDKDICNHVDLGLSKNVYTKSERERTIVIPKQHQTLLMTKLIR